MPLIDLSAPIVPDPPELPDVLRTDLTFDDHAAGAATIATMFGVPAELLRDGEGWAIDTFTRFGTHNSTHVDAPWHYNSTIAGERAQTIDELPLDWFLAPGVVIDATDRADGEALTAADLEERVPRELAERDIVLVHTGRDAFYGELDYIARGPGVTAGGTRWLYDRGVRVMGIDAWGWDAPLHLQAERAKAEGRPGHLLGGPPVRPGLLPDRTAGESRRPPAARLHGLVLPPATGGRQRRAGPRRRRRAGMTGMTAGGSRPRTPVSSWQEDSRGLAPPDPR